MQAQLEAHSSDVEVALSLHYGGVEVHVLGVYPVSSHRRLAACGASRRLQASTDDLASVGAFDITFQVQGGSAQACTTCPSLQQLLQQGFSEASVSLTIEASTVSWRVTDPVAQKETDVVAHREREETGVLILVLGLSFLFLMACAFAICWRLHNCRNKADVDANVQGKSVEDAEKVDAEKGEKGSGGSMRDDASTATPTSEEDNSLGDVELKAATGPLEPRVEDGIVI